MSQSQSVNWKLTFVFIQVRPCLVDIDSKFAFFTGNNTDISLMFYLETETTQVSTQGTTGTTVSTVGTTTPTEGIKQSA